MRIFYFGFLSFKRRHEDLQPLVKKIVLQGRHGSIVHLIKHQVNAGGALGLGGQG